MSDTRKPTVAIIGRPNTGKSTLFNKIIGRRKALESPIPGTTRDYLQADAEWQGFSFTLIDTGGLEEVGSRDQLNQDIAAQIELAKKRADLIIYVTDAREGLTPVDQKLTKILHQEARPAILAVNKADAPKWRQQEELFSSLGFGGPIYISAITGSGIGDLLDEITARLKKNNLPPTTGSKSEPLKLALVGRPNVGKSSLINKIIGQKRIIESPTPYTTRDTIDIFIPSENLILLDTPGVRRQAKIAGGLEKISTSATLATMKEADIIALVVNYEQKLPRQDKRLANLIAQENKDAFIIINKADIIPNLEQAKSTLEKNIPRELTTLSWAKIIFTSAKTELNIDQIIPTAKKLHQHAQIIWPQEKLNEVLKHALLKKTPPPRIDLKSIQQDPKEPTIFILKIKKGQYLPDIYLKYLAKEFRESLKLKNTPLKIVIHKK